MEVSRLGVELELYPLAYSTATGMPDLGLVCSLHHSSPHCWILNLLREARDRPAFSWIFVFVFLGPHLWHMEVPRLGVKSELELPAYTSDPTATAM